jgi:hypothetical protein
MFECREAICATASSQTDHGPFEIALDIAPLFKEPFRHARSLSFSGSIER